MILKQFADSRSITLTKLKKLCSELLGTVPALLTKDQIAKLDAHLLSAAKALNPVIEGNSESAIAPLESADIQQTEPTEIDQKVIEIIGVRELKANLLLYLQQAKSRLQVEKFKAESLIFQAEQRFYSDLANHQKTTQDDSLRRMELNSNLWHSEGLKQLSAGTESEDLNLHNELLELMESFGI
ncbi:hypothetical protein [Nostoc sphaeroides]|uniref:Uncharacterized protein n=1 Tax=Nostoc sphaeroides CCNUC1 TaxID=2653204 RepID=A0A5P8WJ57_9NOSO|nr:hypothetical protein [Nostoc sphaeroides]QFS52887.1 hypothetical protein GXM_10151 [Nostoc sphaeroides CCNUC1]